MKRLWISAGIILLLAVLCGLHVAYLQNVTQDLIEQLETVDPLLSREDWAGAEKVVQSVSETWERQSFYLQATLRHADIDSIRTSLKEIEAYLDNRQDAGECLAATSKLINQLELLLEAELPSLKNVL